MKLSYNAVWEDALRLLRTHGSLVAALAGVFLFLPALLVTHFLPRPEAASVPELIREMVAYFRAHWPWLLLENVANMLGTLAILQLVFRAAGTSVGGAIAGAVRLLPFYLPAAILANLVIGAGFAFVLLLPGLDLAGRLLLLLPVAVASLYLLGRLSLLAPLVVAEEERSPVAALRRTFAVTRGKGWAIIGLVLLIAVAGSILLWVATSLVGILFTLLLPESTALLVMRIVNTGASTALATLLILIYAALYRRLAGTGAAPATPAA